MKGNKKCWNCRCSYSPMRSDQLFCRKECRLKYYSLIGKEARKDGENDWVIERQMNNYGIGGGIDRSYYTGAKYSYKGEDYGEFLDGNRRSEAKKYTSKKELLML